MIYSAQLNNHLISAKSVDRIIEQVIIHIRGKGIGFSIHIKIFNDDGEFLGVMTTEIFKIN